jgi:hypothetical protein
MAAIGGKAEILYTENAASLSGQRRFAPAGGDYLSHLHRAAWALAH